MKLVDFISKLRQIFVDGEPDSPVSPIQLEPVAFQNQTPIYSSHPDMVVDFGTTATVVALVDDLRLPTGQVLTTLELLAGKEEHSSDLSINSNGQIERIGVEAFQDSFNPEMRYYTSLKRYLELQSRGCSQDNNFADIVSEFLQRSIRKQYKDRSRKISHDSQIVISVPNSFNPFAVSQVREGVFRAIAALNGPNQNDDVGTYSIRVARESEAVAYLYRRGSLLTPAPTLETSVPYAKFAWQIIHPSNRESSTPNTGIEQVVVLDVGGGTTDLSLVSIFDTNRDNNGQDVNIRVVMNAGLPLGGTDIDKLLFRAAVAPEIKSPDQLADLAIGDRIKLLKSIRDNKHSDAKQFFEEPEDSSKDEFGKTLAGLLALIPVITMRQGVVIENEANEATVQEFRKQATNRVNNLVQISIKGLFDLIPESAKRDVRRILLTGRGSQLHQIQAAVFDEADKLGAEVLSLDHPYHLKLAVAYGCALVRGDEFSGARLPSGTLGRYLQVVSQSNSVHASFTGDFPVSGDAPTVFEITCPCAEEYGLSYDLWEYRTVLPEEFFTQDDGPTLDQVLWMGCSRSVATWTVPMAGDPGQNVHVRIAWHPESEQYYSIDGTTKPPTWTMRSSADFSLRDINFVTGLPLGFPHEG